MAETELESALYRVSCPCVINPSENSPELEAIKRINHEYQVRERSFYLFNLILSICFNGIIIPLLFLLQAEIQNLISGNRYDGKEDFAVVLQPFLQTFFIPRIGVSSTSST